MPADLAQPERLVPVLRGARSVFLMVAGSGEGLDGPAIVVAAARAGVQQIVLLSSIGSRSRPNAISHEPLRALEAEVRGSGRAWTILQPIVRAERTVAAPFGDVAIPIVDRDDIAAVAAAALRDARHAGATYELTGPTRITPREQAHALEAALGVRLTFVEDTRAQAAEVWGAFMPPRVVETTLDALGTPNEIERRVSLDIERVLGRAQSFAAWTTRHADTLRGGVPSR